MIIVMRNKAVYPSLFAKPFSKDLMLSPLGFESSQIQKQNKCRKIERIKIRLISRDWRLKAGLD